MTRTPTYGLARAASVAALVIAAVVMVVVLLGTGGSYRVHVLLRDGGQLVKGDRVVVGGIPIGRVDDITLDDRNRADVTIRITDAAFDPLHEGTQAAIGSPSLSTEASRFITIHPGPNSAPKLADGAAIAEDRTESAVELDELFNALDYRTRSDLQDIVQGSATQYRGVGAEANRGLEYLSPAVAQLRGLTGELLTDEGAFSDFVVKSAAVVGAVAPRTSDLQGGLESAAALTERLAREDTTIGELLDRAPALLRRARGTLRDVDTALGTARPALRAAQPVAPRLASVLRLAAPVARGARPAVRDLHALLPDVARALRGLPVLSRAGTAALGDATTALRGAGPIVSAVRPYTPDVVSGLFNGFGGTVGPYYDANGRYAHIGFMLPPNFLVQGAATIGDPLATLLDQAQGGGFLSNYPNYCPGGSTYPPADRSAPFLDPAVSGHCDPGQKAGP